MVPLLLTCFFSKCVSPSSLIASHPLLYMSTISPAFSLIIKGNPESITSLFPFDISHNSNVLSCLLFARLRAISLVSTSHQILYDWCEHHFHHNISWHWFINTMIKWDDYLLFFSQEALSQLDAVLDATYTDAKDISKHESSRWQKYDITLLRCSFFSTYYSDYDITKPHCHKFTYQVQYK